MQIAKTAAVQHCNIALHAHVFAISSPSPRPPYALLAKASNKLGHKVNFIARKFKNNQLLNLQ